MGGIFTFGAPRIGNVESASITAGLYEGRFFRYMHGSDMVRGISSYFMLLLCKALHAFLVLCRAHALQGSPAR